MGFKAPPKQQTQTTMNQTKSLAFANGADPEMVECSLPQDIFPGGQPWEEIQLTDKFGYELSWRVRRNDQGKVILYSGMAGLKSYKTLKGLRNYAKRWVIK